ncbi:phosphatase 2C-like domain-containing protein [Mycena galericulata]|nr:phosphatase 2C-like domain-containing protein [Mycena galericulata]
MNKNIGGIVMLRAWPEVAWASGFPNPIPGQCAGLGTADPTSVVFGSEHGWRADAVNFQPHAITQDRYVLRQLKVHDQLWILTGVFDGHLGDETVEHVAHHLPIIRTQPTGFIADLLSRSIIAFDEAIVGDILELFGGSERLADYSDQQIRDIINDQGREYENLWVANLGDCQAVLVSPKDTQEWDVDFITTEHNGDNDDEIERVHREHPGEPEYVVNRRVLGALSPFRGLGDVPFKQPSFTQRVLYNLAPGFSDTAPWEICLARNLTPPYISAAPEITHRSLGRARPPGPRYLVLASDGFTDLCRSRGREHVLAARATREADSHGEMQGNLASRLLRQVIGGEDRASVSCMLTLDMEIPWVDDTSIVVQTL